MADFLAGSQLMIWVDTSHCLRFKLSLAKSQHFLSRGGWILKVMLCYKEYLVLLPGTHVILWVKRFGIWDSQPSASAGVSWATNLHSHSSLVSAPNWEARTKPSKFIINKSVRYNPECPAQPHLSIHRCLDYSAGINSWVLLLKNLLLKHEAMTSRLVSILFILQMWLCSASRRNNPVLHWTTMSDSKPQRSDEMLHRNQKRLVN